MRVLKLECVRKAFRGDMSLAKREVLHGVSLAAEAGEVLGFLGPNGAGKTTTIKIILGLIRPDAGVVKIFDRPPGDRDAMARIGFLPETPYFHPHLSLREFLEFCGTLSRVPRAELPRRIERVVERVDLTAHVDRRLGTFSKGMLQRSGLAQAILHEPELLILDEPFSGLDPVGRKMVRDILVDLKQRGRTIFFSSHILPDMEALCDRACIIRGGLITTCVGIDDLVRLGEGKIEITARRWKPGMLRGIRDYVESSSERGTETLLVVRAQKFVRPVIEHLYEAGAEILEVVNQHASLEDLFMQEINGSAPAGRERARDEAVFAGF